MKLTREQIKTIERIEITELDLYLLDIIKWEYIDESNSYISDNGEIYLKIKTDILPIPNIKVVKPKGTGCIYHSVKDVFEKGLFDLCDFERDTFYVKINNTGLLMDVKRTTRLTKSRLLGVFDRPNIVSCIVEDMCICNHPDYDKYQKQINDFAQSAMNWSLSKIRKSALFDDIEGEFISDKIIYDTYMQQRIINNESVCYIINEWWRSLADKTVTFADIDNGKAKTFVAVR